VQAH
jgi:hypothetical protein